MENRQNFNNIQQRVNLYLDQELSSDAEKELLHEAESDKKVKEILEAERGFREMLRIKVQRSHVSPDFIKSIKKSIRKG